MQTGKKVQEANYSLTFKKGERKMTNYEYLITKSDRCVSAARKAQNEEIREVWLEKAEKLKAEATNLSIEEAGKTR